MPTHLNRAARRPVGACRHRRLIVSELSQLSPQPLWDIFAKICSIPHPSYHEEALAQHILTGPKKRTCTPSAIGSAISCCASRPPKAWKTASLSRCRRTDMVPQRITTPCTTSPGSDPALYRRRVGESARHHAGRRQRHRHGLRRRCWPTTALSTARWKCC